MNYFFILIFVCYANDVFGIPETSKYQNCSISKYQSKFDVLPGMGWDNLQNTDMGRILDLKFSNCLFSDDNKFLIPNEVSLLPKKASHVDLYSETFSHFLNYTSITSLSMGMKAEGFIHLFKLGGQFSYENKRVKSYQLESKSTITRVQLRYTNFQTKMEPDAPLHKNFKYRILELARWMNNYNVSIYSSYLADMIIRDFGTHVIRSVDAGGVLAKTDTLDSSYIKKYSSDSTTITASASASFLNLFKLNASITSRASQAQLEEFNKMCKRTLVDTKGGAPFGTDFGIDKWVASLKDNLVPIDRTGDPIYYILNKKVLPELNENTIHKLSNILRESINRYYDVNGRKGCLNFNALNFNPDANIDGNNCEFPIVRFTFGGVYKTCIGRGDQCDSVQRSNFLTGAQSCPNGFAPVLLNSGSNECRQYCSGWWLWRHCHTDCSNYQLFWCYPLTYSPNHNGYRFGGFLSTVMTQCPLGYIPISLGSATFCVTSDSSLTNPFAVGFGGFFSCKVGNPLARSFFKDKKNMLRSSKLGAQESWHKDCAEGYVAHIALIDQNCQISYCTETNKYSLGPIPIIKRPPFFKISVSLNDSKPKFMKYENGDLYIHNIGQTELSRRITPDITASIVGPIVGGFVLVFIICLLIVLWRRRSRSRKSDKKDIKESFISYGSLINRNNQSYEPV